MQAQTDEHYKPRVRNLLTVFDIITIKCRIRVKQVVYNTYNVCTGKLREIGHKPTTDTFNYNLVLTTVTVVALML